MEADPQAARASPARCIGRTHPSRKALLLEPYDGAPRLRVAHVLYQLGDAEGAIDEFRHTLAISSGHRAGHLGLGTALMAKQDWRTALVELQEAVRLGSEPRAGLFQHGDDSLYAGRPLAAMQAYREALRLKPQDGRKLTTDWALSSKSLEKIRGYIPRV